MYFLLIFIANLVIAPDSISCDEPDCDDHTIDSVVCDEPCYERSVNSFVRDSPSCERTINSVVCDRPDCDNRTNSVVQSCTMKHTCDMVTE